MKEFKAYSWQKDTLPMGHVVDSTKMQSKTILVTPEMAEEMLKRNKNNRNLRKTRVRSLSIAMTRGEFKLSHQGIAFDQNGYLIDGQHRLSAVVDSGVSVYMTVFSGCPKDSFDVLDIGAKRNFSDSTGVDGFMSQVANHAIYIQKGRNPASFGETIEYCDAISDFYYKIFPNKTTRKLFSSAPFRLGVVYAFMSGATSAEYAARSAYAMQHEEFGVMSPRVIAAYKRISKMNTTRGKNSHEIFFVASAGVDEQLSHVGSILIRAGSIEQKLSEFRLFMDKLISKRRNESAEY